MVLVVLVVPRDGSAMVVPAGLAGKAGPAVTLQNLCTLLMLVVLEGLEVPAGPVVLAGSGWDLVAQAGPVVAGAQVEPPTAPSLADPEVTAAPEETAVLAGGSETVGMAAMPGKAGLAA